MSCRRVTLKGRFGLTAWLAGLVIGLGLTGARAQTLTWTGAGDFVTEVGAGNTTIGSGVTLNITTSADHLFPATALINNGTTNWSGSGSLRGWDGASFTNNNLFNDQNTTGAALYPTYNNNFVFTNASGGTYTKSGSATTTFSIGFTNDGIVNVQAGILSLAGGGTNTGSFVTSSGAITQFANDYSLATGSSLTGAGTYDLNGGTLTASGGITVTKLDLNGGLLAGTQTFNTSTLNWIGSSLASGGTTTIASTSTLNILASADHFLNSRAIVNNGTTNWSGGGSLRGWDGASFTNNGQFNDQNTTGAALYPTFNNNFTFTNASSGTYTKSGSATTIFSIGFNNAGTVNVQAGVFNLSGGGTNSGSFVTTSGAVTQFDADYILSAGSSLTGTGDYLLNAGSLAPDGNVTVSRLDLSGGALVGTQTFNNSTLNWTASSLGTSGATTIAGTSTFNILTSADHFLNSRAIVNNGTTNWSGGGSLRGWDGASFTNNGQFNDQNTSGAALYPTYNNNFTFTNASGGSYSKTGNSTTTFGMAFTNAGSIAVHAGTLVFNDTFANTNGSISLTNNAALISASSIALGTGSLAGSGSLTAQSVSAGGVISPGAPVGQLNITSDLTLLGTALATFEIGGRSQGVTYDFLSVSGNATLNGTLALTFANGFQSSVLNTDTFAILSAASLAGTFANVINGGRLATLDGAGSFQVNYSGVGVSLSNFIAVPEPSTYSLLALGLAALARAARRRRRSPAFAGLNRSERGHSERE